MKSKLLKKGKYSWINRRDLEVESVYNNWANTFDKCNPEKQKYRYKLILNAKSQPCRRFVRNDLVERKIKSCRIASVKFLKFQEKLGVDSYKITRDEKDIVSALQVAFEDEIIHI